jgi:DNA polymerase-3 subunit alpha
MYLIFDTETTGLPANYNAPPTDTNNWPRMVQLAWECHDATGHLTDARSYIVKPEGYTIPFAAEKVHGITTEKALAEGVDLLFVLEEFEKCLSHSSFVIGHNVEFDLNIIKAEYVRKGFQSRLPGMVTVCTKEESTGFCALPGGRGGKFKWPTLDELYNKLFQEGFEEAHNAAADVAATARCFLELLRLDIISPRLKPDQSVYRAFLQANPVTIPKIEIPFSPIFMYTHSIPSLMVLLL